MKIVALFLIKVLKPFCLVIFFLSCSFSRPSWSLKASRLLYFLHINMSPSSATAGCQLNAALGLRKHHHCLLTDSLSPFTHKRLQKKQKSLEIWATCHLVCDYESFPGSIQMHSSFASLSVSYMGERENSKSLHAVGVCEGGACVCVCMRSKRILLIFMETTGTEWQTQQICHHFKRKMCWEGNS